MRFVSSGNELYKKKRFFKGQAKPHGSGRVGSGDQIRPVGGHFEHVNLYVCTPQRYVCALGVMGI